MFMTTLYKYLKKEHAELLFDAGGIRIGTLYSFRKNEKFGDEIGDRGEGTDLGVWDVNDITLDQKTMPPQLNSLFSLGVNSKIRLSDVRVGMHYHSKNRFIYCCSHFYDEHAMIEMGYDSCVEVFNPRGFFKAISKRLKKIADYEGYMKCAYVDRERHLFAERDFPAHYLKPNNYAHQKEVRACWLPRSEIEMDFYDVTIDSPNKFCKIRACK